MNERCHDGRPVFSSSISWAPDPKDGELGYTALVITHTHGIGEPARVDVYRQLTVHEARDVIEQVVTGYHPGALHVSQGTLW